MAQRNDPFAQIQALTQRLHTQAAALKGSTEGFLDTARHAMDNTPGPLAFLGQRAWSRRLGAPLQGPLADTHTPSDRTVVVFPDGRTMELATDSQGLMARKGLLWPLRAKAFAPTAAQTVEGWKRELITWDLLETLGPPPVAHVAMQRRAPRTTTPTTTILQAQDLVGRARLVHRLWSVDLVWHVGGSIAAEFKPSAHQAEQHPNMILQSIWKGESLAPIAKAFAKRHPTLDRFERSLGWMVFGRWCGWPLFGNDHAPIWLGVTPTGGIA